jgi:hypothetical protein
MQTRRTQSKTNTAAANTAVTLTFPGVADRRWVLRKFSGSYSAAPTAGRVTVAFGGVTAWDLDLGTGALLTESFGEDGLRAPDGKAGQDMTLTLAAGGGTAVGKLNALAHCE